jgi:D-glycero-D-manno-heptose 1,7-bisphosphate phosphatase
LEKQKIVILDRDGTLIENIDYLNDKKLIRFLPGCIEALKLLQQLDYSLFIVTNQSGIGRGIITYSQYTDVTEALKTSLEKHGVNILDVKHCPHLPEDFCKCRKPNIELGIQIIQTNDIDLDQSFVIGDSLTDMAFGRELNMQCILIGNEIKGKSTSFLNFQDWYGIINFVSGIK